MARPGPKPSQKAKAREPLQADPPSELRLKGRALAIYKALAERLRAEGFAAQIDARTVGLAATTSAFVERLEGEVAALPTLTVAGSQGQERLHPLLGELRAARGQLQSLLASLLMSPRSRSASRLSDQWRQAPAKERDEFDDYTRKDAPPDKSRFFNQPRS